MYMHDFAHLLVLTSHQTPTPDRDALVAFDFHVPSFECTVWFVHDELWRIRDFAQVYNK